MKQLLTTLAAFAFATPAFAFSPTQKEVRLAVFIYTAAICEKKTDPNHDEKWRGGFIVEFAKVMGTSFDRIKQVQEATPDFWKRAAALARREGGCAAMVKQAGRLEDGNIAPKPALAGKTEEDHFEF